MATHRRVNPPFRGAMQGPRVTESKHGCACACPCPCVHNWRCTWKLLRCKDGAWASFCECLFRMPFFGFSDEKGIARGASNFLGFITHCDTTYVYTIGNKTKQYDCNIIKTTISHIFGIVPHRVTPNKIPNLGRKPSSQTKSLCFENHPRNPTGICQINLLAATTPIQESRPKK